MVIMKSLKLKMPGKILRAFSYLRERISYLLRVSFC